MTTLNPEATELDLGRVIKEIAEVLQRNLVPFVVLAAILIGVPAVLAGWAAVGIFATGGLHFGPGVFVTGLVRLVTSLVLQAALIYGTVSDLNGRRASVSQCLSVGLNDFLPLLAIGVLLGLAVCLGLILLVVPGIIVAVMWCVAIPAFVAEGVPVMQSFGRSAQLTEGNRLRIFGLFVIFLLGAIVLQAVVGAITGPAYFLGGGFGFWMRSVVVEPIVDVVTGLIAATGSAVLYVELRRLKEGVAVETLAADMERKDGPAKS